MASTFYFKNRGPDKSSKTFPILFEFIENLTFVAEEEPPSFQTLNDYYCHSVDDDVRDYLMQRPIAEGNGTLQMAPRFNIEPPRHPKSNVIQLDDSIDDDEAFLNQLIDVPISHGQITSTKIAEDEPEEQVDEFYKEFDNSKETKIVPAARPPSKAMISLAKSKERKNRIYTTRNRFGEFAPSWVQFTASFPESLVPPKPKPRKKKVGTSLKKIGNLADNEETYDDGEDLMMIEVDDNSTQITSQLDEKPQKKKSLSDYTIYELVRKHFKVLICFLYGLDSQPSKDRPLRVCECVVCPPMSLSIPTLETTSAAHPGEVLFHRNRKIDAWVIEQQLGSIEENAAICSLIQATMETMLHEFCGAHFPAPYIPDIIVQTGSHKLRVQYKDLQAEQALALRIAQEAAQERDRLHQITQFHEHLPSVQSETIQILSRPTENRLVTNYILPSPLVNDRRLRALQAYNTYTSVTMNTVVANPHHALMRSLATEKQIPKKKKNDLVTWTFTRDPRIICLSKRQRRPTLDAQKDKPTDAGVATPLTKVKGKKTAAGVPFFARKGKGKYYFGAKKKKLSLDEKKDEVNDEEQEILIDLESDEEEHGGEENGDKKQKKRKPKLVDDTSRILNKKETDATCQSILRNSDGILGRKWIDRWVNEERSDMRYDPNDACMHCFFYFAQFSTDAVIKPTTSNPITKSKKNEEEHAQLLSVLAPVQVNNPRKRKNATPPARDTKLSQPPAAKRHKS
jgi:hypothetical protein